MNLKTYSKFYFDYIISENNCWLEFSDPSGTKQIKIQTGGYTLTTLGVYISQVMTLNSNYIYTVTIDRPNRKYTISSTVNFTLKFLSGTYNNLSCYSILGFNKVDYFGASSYTSVNSTGKVYYPQFYLKNYIDGNYNKFPLSAVVNRSSSGNVNEVVRFGFINLYKFEIVYTTNIVLENSYIKTNQNGLADLKEFMEYIVNKVPIEIIPDEENDSTYDIITIETTPQSQDGVSFEISPNYSEEIPEFYSIGGELTFRRVN